MIADAHQAARSLELSLFEGRGNALVRGARKEDEHKRCGADGERATNR
jgi:hypothetical protein